MIDAEEIAFSNYLLPKITLIASDAAPGLVLTQDIEFEEEVPEGTEILLEVSGKKLSANIPNIPPCFYSSDEAESLIKEFMRENSIILFFKKNFQTSELQGCEGKVIGTNVAQGGVVSTGDTLIIYVDSSSSDSS